MQWFSDCPSIAIVLNPLKHSPLAVFIKTMDKIRTTSQTYHHFILWEISAKSLETASPSDHTDNSIKEKLVLPMTWQCEVTMKCWARSQNTISKVATVDTSAMDFLLHGWDFCNLDMVAMPIAKLEIQDLTTNRNHK
jgi:hypothetical protein